MRADAQLLSALLQNPKHYVKYQKQLSREPFKDNALLKIFQCFKAFIKDNGLKDYNLFQCADYIEKKLKLKSGEIIKLTSQRQESYMLDYAIEKVLEEFNQEQIHKFSKECNTLDVSEFVQQSTNLVNEIQLNQVSKERTLQEILKESLEDIQKVRNGEVLGITSGFKSIDNFTRGFGFGDLVIVAGRSSMGKTSFALSMINNMIYAGVPVAFFSLEMSDKQLLNRMISLNAHISTKRMTSNPSDQEIDKWCKYGEELISKPLIIDESGSNDLNVILAQIRHFHMINDTKCIVIDYLQLVSFKTSQNKEQELADISRALKNIAKELNIVVVLLSQLNRGGKGQESKRPALPDLRGSGQIEEAADSVYFIHRPEYYGIEFDEENNSTKGLAEIILAKGRNTGVGRFKLKFISELTKFKNYEQDNPFPNEAQENAGEFTTSNLEPFRDFDQDTEIPF